MFDFNKKHLLGVVCEVDSRSATILVKNDDLAKARIGHLVAMKLTDDERYIIGIIGKITKAVERQSDHTGLRIQGDDGWGDASGLLGNQLANTVRLTLVGTVDNAANRVSSFSRSLVRMPDINTECCVLQGEQLDAFMGLISSESEGEDSLILGEYSLSQTVALLDGNKFFQRHAALLGTTGAGKSWTVASILGRAAKLPSARLIVFDIHGEYRSLSFASHLRIPGPEDLSSVADDLLYLPYWLLTAEEMQSMFVDSSEFNAHNQTAVFQQAVIDGKRFTLRDLEKNRVLEAFTLDSPVPFNINSIIEHIEKLNSEMVNGSRGPKQGPYYGQFTRMLSRLKGRIADRRYGFLFQTPAKMNEYGAMSALAAKLLDHTKAGVKVIDFSDVPSDVLPTIVGLVARIIYQVQFWTDREQRRPLALICDEAHLYLPQKAGHNPVERRAIENFEKIAKEGRKYGVSLVIISQRPSDVNSTILSQANNVIALRLSNADDQGIVRRLMPESLSGLVDALPALDIGEAIVIGDAVLLPSRVRITPPQEKPLSSTMNFWAMWQESISPMDFETSVENMRRQGRGNS